MILFKNKMSAMTESFEIEHDGLAMAMFESSREFSELQGGVPVALSNVYEMFVTDTSKTEEQKTAVLEGVMSDAWEKIKNFFKKIADKIRAWFKSVIKFFQTIFMSNKKFVEKFKEEILGKNSSKFTYQGHNWHNQNDSFVNKFSAADSKVEAAFKLAEEASKTGREMKSENTAYKIADKKKEIDQALGVKSVGDMTTKMTKEITGGDVREIKNFSVFNVSTMIKIIEDGKETIDNFKELADGVSETAESYSDKIDKLRSAYESKNEDAAERSNFVAYANNAASVGKYLLSYQTAHINKWKELSQKMISECSSALRSFARYKPAKEDYIPEGASGSQSLLEAYMIDA